MYSEIAEPVEDVMYEDITAQTFQKGTILGTMGRKMQLGVDGNLSAISDWSVSGTNPGPKRNHLRNPSRWSQLLAPLRPRYTKTTRRSTLTQKPSTTSPLYADLRPKHMRANFDGNTGGSSSGANNPCQFPISCTGMRNGDQKRAPGCRTRTPPGNQTPPRCNTTITSYY